VQGCEFYAAIAWNFCRWFCGYLLFIPVVALSVGRERFMPMGEFLGKNIGTHSYAPLQVVVDIQVIKGDASKRLLS
jgi:hypothetical protein